MRGFLAEEEGDCESETVERDLIQEISCRHILHWNYRGLTSLPKQLLGSKLLTTILTIYIIVQITAVMLRKYI